MSIVKINWGARIAVLYGGFVVIIVLLVAGSMRQSFDLVAPDYYGQEIKYQQVIDAGKNSAALSTPVIVKTDNNQVVIDFPKDFAGKVLSGTVQFYSPVNASWDKSFPINTNDNDVIVARDLLKPTTYKVKMNWSCEGKQYYQESEINLH
jgi:nitrogen fixation protein FixH